MRKGSQRIILTVGILFLTAGLVMAAVLWGGYRKGQEEYQKIRKCFVSLNGTETSGDGTPSRNQSEVSSEYRKDAGRGEQESKLPGKEAVPSDAPPCPVVDWEGLLDLNRDVAAWLELPAAGISYPVVRGRDNDYYLHRSVAGEEVFAGSIFMDSRCEPDWIGGSEPGNTVIYGHNMRDGTMFAGLHRLNDDISESLPWFWLCTPEKEVLYRIFSVHTARAAGEEYRLIFPELQNYDGWLRQMRRASAGKEESIPGWDVRIGEDEVPDTVTLSTCTGDDDWRQVVQGIQVWRSG